MNQTSKIQLLGTTPNKSIHGTSVHFAHDFKRYKKNIMKEEHKIFWDLIITKGFSTSDRIRKKLSINELNFDYYLNFSTAAVYKKQINFL